MRAILAAAVVSALPAVALAETDISTEIAETGIAPTLARLSALDSPSDEERFAVAGLEFLNALSQAYQLRWEVGMPRDIDMMFGMAGRLPENDTTRNLDPAEITALLSNTLDAMERARTALAGIPEDSDFGLVLRFGDLWIDLDRDGKRAEYEDFAEMVGVTIWGWRWMSQTERPPLPEIRLDVADAAWLSAYTHMIAGSTEMILAYDPEPSIARVLEAKSVLRGAPEPGGRQRNFESFVDLFAIIDGTLRHEPAVARTVAARDHFLAMVAENRIFWTRVAAETDNDREWIPNDAQVSATGIPFPKGIGANWQRVLADAEGLLTGKLAAPYWDVEGFVMGNPDSASIGIDISRMFTEPRPIDLVGWIQGWGALPYLSDAPLVTSANMQRFEMLVSGQAPLFMVFLN